MVRGGEVRGWVREVVRGEVRGRVREVLEGGVRGRGGRRGGESGRWYVHPTLRTLT